LKKRSGPKPATLPQHTTRRLEGNADVVLLAGYILDMLRLPTVKGNAGASVDDLSPLVFGFVSRVKTDFDGKSEKVSFYRFHCGFSLLEVVK
jgi:hypothetical protein